MENWNNVGPNNKLAIWGWFKAPICGDFGDDLLLGLPQIFLQIANHRNRNSDILIYY